MTAPPPLLQIIFCMHFNEECTIFIFWKLFSVSVTTKFTNQISVEILLQNLAVSIPTQFATIPTLRLIHCYVHALHDSFTEYALCNVSPKIKICNTNWSLGTAIHCYHLVLLFTVNQDKCSCITYADTFSHNHILFCA